MEKTKTRGRTRTEWRHPDEPADIEYVEYPAEVVARWRTELEIARLQRATGEIKPKTAAQMAAERGITLD